MEKIKVQQAVNALKTQFGIVPPSGACREHLQWTLEQYDYILVYNHIVNKIGCKLRIGTLLTIILDGYVFDLLQEIKA